MSWVVVGGLVHGLLEDVGWVVGQVVDVLSLFMNRGSKCPKIRGSNCPKIRGSNCPKIGGSNCPKIGGSKCPMSKCPTTVTDMANICV